MSSVIDSILINNLEKGVEGDQNDQSTIIGRHIGELVRALTGEHGIATKENSNLITADTVQLSASRVWGFNVVSFSLSNRSLTLGPGVVLATGGGAASGGLDSTYRIGLSLANQVVTLPSVTLGMREFFLVEAQVSQTVENEDRDILTNPATFDFTQMNVPKRRLNGVTLSFETGVAENIPDPSANGVPLWSASVFGVSMEESSIRDHRTSPFDVNQPTSTRISDGYSITAPKSFLWNMESETSASFALAANVNGFNGVARTLPGDSLSLSNITSPTDATLTENDWYFVYMFRAPVGGGRVAAQEDFHGNCGLVVSSVVPVRSTRGNSAAIALPFPWIGRNLAIGGGACVGVLRASATDEFSRSTVSAGGRVSVPAIRRTFENPAVTAFPAPNNFNGYGSFTFLIDPGLGVGPWFPIQLATTLRIKASIALLNDNVNPVPVGTLIRIFKESSLVFDVETYYDYGYIDPFVTESETILELPAFTENNDTEYTIRVQGLPADGVRPAAGAGDSIAILTRDTEFAFSLLGFDL